MEKTSEHDFKWKELQAGLPAFPSEKAGRPAWSSYTFSKTGSKEMRSLLSEAAMCLMYNVKTWNRLKVFGLKILKKHGHKKAVVALGRKLGVVMHRMLLDRKSFDLGKVEQKEIDILTMQSKREKKALKKSSPKAL